MIMQLKHLWTICLLTGLSVTGVQAQEYYDITEHYVQNATFDARFDYNASATGNVKSTVRTITNWTRDNASGTSLVVGATFQYGTKATFYDASIPATGPDGSSDGGCLALCASMSKELVFYQNVKLPAGKYQLVVSYNNRNPQAEAGISLSGWKESDDNQVLSTLEAFTYDEWKTDVIAFELSDVTSGRLQVGIKSPGGIAGSNALCVIDNVKLLRDQPYGEVDDILPAPEVVGDTRFARGATMAFGRISSISGDDITERGYCWGETPEPTVNDNYTTEKLSNHGDIYVLSNLTPATKYYMRAYAKNKNGKVGYGKVIKFYTIPKGNITVSWNNGGDAETNNRMNAAVKQAADIFNALTSIRKSFNSGYSPGTPTADCAYVETPWINMGSNASYQRTGTLMHEMQHGLGVIPYSTQWNGSILRSGNGTGQWLGDRVSAFLDFWDNTTGSRLNGDTQHMWPYGINGASEDNGKLETYYANALIGQALGEDGLEHTYSTYADPCYIFDQEDDVKYYLKNESVDRGLYTSYLVATSTGALQWKEMSSAEAIANDEAAWYITFTPKNQYYQFRNAATGQYLTYSSGFKTVAHANPTAQDNIHLMKGRIDVGSGESAQRGYWLIHPTSNWEPQAMQANANGAVGYGTFNRTDNATTQRWLILTAEELAVQEQAAMSYLKEELSSYLANINTLADVPHSEKEDGTDDAYKSTINNIKESLKTSTSTVDIASLKQQAEDAVYQFLCNVTPTDVSKPFNLTYMIKNAGLDALDGWSGTPSLNYSCAEFYQNTFDFYQTIKQLPGGNYKFCANAFQRPGAYATAYSDYEAGNNKVNTYIYAGNKSAKIAHIASEARTSKLGGREVSVGGNKYIPDDMQAASIYFSKGLYDNSVIYKVPSNGASMKAGIRCTSTSDGYWVIFDNFRLYFYGDMTEETISQGIDIVSQPTVDVQRYYDLQGRRVDIPTKGIYIVNGKKVVIK